MGELSFLLLLLRLGWQKLLLPLLLPPCLCLLHLMQELHLMAFVVAAFAAGAAAYLRTFCPWNPFLTMLTVQHLLLEHLLSTQTSQQWPPPPP